MEERGNPNSNGGEQPMINEEELINQIRNYFENNYKVNIEVKEVALWSSEFLLKCGVKLKEEEYSEFHKFLEKLGFIRCDEYSYQISPNRFYGYDEFKTEDNIVHIIIYYAKVKHGNKISYHVKEMELSFRVKK